jgi:TRAP-type C4-dicarboxylate transport system permease small subunit
MNIKEHKLHEGLVFLNKFIAGSLFVVMCVVVISAVILRYFFGITPRWTGELTQILFIHMVFLGIPMAFRKRMHVTIEFFVSLLPATFKSWLDRFIDLVIIGFLTAVTVSTVHMMSGRLGQTLTPGLKLPRLMIYVAVPICTVLLGIEIVRRFFDKDYS